MYLYCTESWIIERVTLLSEYDNIILNDKKYLALSIFENCLINYTLKIHILKSLEDAEPVHLKENTKIVHF